MINKARIFSLPDRVGTTAGPQLKKLPRGAANAMNLDFFFREDF
jgi:hypothetical protein